MRCAAGVVARTAGREPYGNETTNGAAASEARPAIAAGVSLRGEVARGTGAEGNRGSVSFASDGGDIACAGGGRR